MRGRTNSRLRAAERAGNVDDDEEDRIRVPRVCVPRVCVPRVPVPRVPAPGDRAHITARGGMRAAR